MKARQLRALAALFVGSLAVAGMLTLLGVWSAGSPVVQAQGDGVWTVCPAGPPDCDYAVIQDAVDAASDGDLIKVATGVYTGVQGRPVPPGYPYPPASGVVTQVVYISKTVALRGGYTAPGVLIP